MSPVKTDFDKSDNVSELVARYQLVIERARISNVSPEAIFEVLRMEASEWKEEQISAAVLRVQQSQKNKPS
jgi:hypothetical protein